MIRIAFIVVAVILTLASMTTNCNSSGDNADSEAIKKTIQDMWAAYNEGDYAEALTFCINYEDYDDEIAQMTAMKNFTGNVSVKSIKNINVTGSSAAASVTLSIPAQDDIDEVKLVKIDGYWKVDMAESYGDRDNTNLSWNEMTSGTINQLNGIWGSTSSDVFAVGYFGTILHYDGSAWSTMNSGTTNEFLYGIWGGSSSDIFVVGDSGTILYYDGISWDTMDSGTTNNLSDVWGSSSSDVFAVGYEYPSGVSFVLHYDGSSWSTMTSGIPYMLWGIWGSSSSDVYAVGYNGTIMHYNGSSWRAMASDTTDNLNSVWGSSDSDVFAVSAEGTVLHYDGSSWSTIVGSTGFSTYGIWGSSSTDVFAVGLAGEILHYEGSSWSNRPSGDSYGLYDI